MSPVLVVFLEPQIISQGAAGMEGRLGETQASLGTVMSRTSVASHVSTTESVMRGIKVQGPSTSRHLDVALLVVGRNADGLAEPLGPREVLRHCTGVLGSFEEAKKSPDSHFEAYMGEQGRKIRLEEDAIFVQQVFLGMLRYSRLLDAAMRVFLGLNSAQTARGDGPAYRVLLYLAIFRLDEISFDSLAEIVCEWRLQPGLVLVEFLFSEDTMGLLRAEWLQHVDPPFVDSLLARLRSYFSEGAKLKKVIMDGLFMAEQAAADEASGAKASKRKPIVPKPFNLTESKPKMRPASPEVTPASKRLPPPKVKKGPTKEQEALAAAQLANRARAEQLAREAKEPKLSQARMGPFERTLAEVEIKLTEAMRPVPPTKPVPRYPEVTYAETATSILREDARYKRKQLEEYAQLEKYESELRDDYEFQQWKKVEEAHEEEERQARVKALKEDMAASRLRAVRAKEEKFAQNAEGASLLKLQAREMMEKRKELKKLSAEERRRAAEASRTETRVRNEIARADMLQTAKAKAADLARAKEEALKEARIREEKERAAREARAREVREQVLAVRKPPPEKFDPDYIPKATPMLNQISYNQMKEMVTAQEDARNEYVALKQAVLSQKKQESKSDLSKKKERSLSIRRMAMRDGDTRRELARLERLASVEMAQRKAEEELLLVDVRLAEKRERERVQRETLAAERAIVAAKNAELASGASAVEEARWTSIETGKQRKAMSRQEVAQTEGLVYEETKAKAETQLMKNVNDELDETKRRQKEYAIRAEAARAANHASQEAEMRRKQALIKAEHERTGNLRLKMSERPTGKSARKLSPSEAEAASGAPAEDPMALPPAAYPNN